MSNKLQDAVKKIVLEVLSEKELSTGNYKPEVGTVLSINGDGTVGIQTDANHYQSCGVATTDCYVVGLRVFVLAADGVQVAIPAVAAGVSE